MIKQGTLKFELEGNQCVLFLLDVKDKAAVTSFAAAVQPYSRAAITRAAYTETEILQGVETPSQPLADLNYYAIIKMRNPGTRKLYSFQLFAPAYDMFQLVEGKGYRVSTEVGQILTEAYMDLSGLDLSFSDGWLCGSYTTP